MEFIDNQNDCDFYFLFCLQSLGLQQKEVNPKIANFMGNQTNNGCFRHIASYKSQPGLNKSNQNLQFNGVTKKIHNQKNNSFINQTAAKQGSSIVLKNDSNITGDQSQTQTNDQLKIFNQVQNPESPCSKKSQSIKYSQKMKDEKKQKIVNKQASKITDQDKKVIQIEKRGTKIQENIQNIVSNQIQYPRETRYTNIDDLCLPQQTVGQRSNFRISTIC